MDEHSADEELSASWHAELAHPGFFFSALSPFLLSLCCLDALVYEYLKCPSTIPSRSYEFLDPVLSKFKLPETTISGEKAISVVQPIDKEQSLLLWL